MLRVSNASLVYISNITSCVDELLSVLMKFASEFDIFVSGFVSFAFFYVTMPIVEFDTFSVFIMFLIVENILLHVLSLWNKHFKVTSTTQAYFFFFVFF